MESSSFYITLPSNASKNYYSNNKASNYTIRMPRTFYLQGKYEVGLAEIQYPHTWPSVREDMEYFVCVRRYDGPEDNYRCAFIPDGYYKTVQTLCDEITRRIDEREERADKCVRFKYHEVTRRVYFETEEYEVRFSKGLAEILGYRYRDVDDLWYQNLAIADRKADIAHGFFSLFVYCSICEPQVVGDFYVPLLRTVAIEGQDGDHILKSYDEPHYVPVNTSKFDTIEINIKNDTGDDVAFESGKVLCKLHFRQKAL